MHKYVPGHNKTDEWTKQPQKVLSGGDYLTFERHKQAQSSKRNGRTPTKRLEGLVPKMEEFHNQGELLKDFREPPNNTVTKGDANTVPFTTFMPSQLELDSIASDFTFLVAKIWTGQPATTPTRSPSITSGKPSTASTPTTGTEAGGPGTSPSLIPTTTGPASTTTGLETCPDDSPKGSLTLDSVTSTTTPDGAENALKPTGWKPSPGDTSPVLELKPTDTTPIMNIAVETELVDSVVFKLYKDGVLVEEKTVKVKPTGVAEVEFKKPVLADDIKLTIIPVTTPNVAPVVKNIVVEACIKAVTTGQPATTPTSSPVFTSVTPSTASAPTTGTQAGATGTSPPLIPTTTGPASTTTGLEICPDDSTKGPITLDSVTSPTSPDGTENALKPTGWKPSPGDDNPVLELKPTDTTPIMNIAVETELVDSVVFKLYKDGVLVEEKTVKVKPTGVAEVEFKKPVLADDIKLTIIPVTTPNVAPVVKNIVVEACIKAVTTGQPATTPTSSPVFTSGTSSTASAPTTGTQAGAPGTSPPLIPTTTGPASTTTGLETCPDDSPKGSLTLDSVTSTTTPDGAENALKPTGWKPSPGDTSPVLELKPTDTTPIMNIAVETELVDSVVFKLYKDGVLVEEKTVKVKPTGVAEVEFKKPVLADDIKLTIIPVTTPNVAPVVKNIVVEACIKAVTTGQPATTPTSSPVFTSVTPSTASAPTTGTQAGATGTSPPLIPTTTGPASTTTETTTQPSTTEVTTATECVKEKVVLDESNIESNDLSSPLSTIDKDALQEKDDNKFVETNESIIVLLVSGLDDQVNGVKVTGDGIATITVKYKLPNNQDFITVQAPNVRPGDEIPLELKSYNVIRITVTKEPGSNSIRLDSVEVSTCAKLTTVSVVSTTALPPSTPVTSQTEKAPTTSALPTTVPTTAVTAVQPTKASSPSITSGPSSTTSVPTTTPGYCKFSQEQFVDNFGYEQIGLVGYIEKDDKTGITSEEEKVFIDSSFDAGVVVVVGCSNCTCEGSGMIRCVVGECKECKYSDWGEWSPCSRDCDVGSTSRSRSKLSLMSPEKCPDDLLQTKDCNIDNCPMPTTVELCSPWDDWTECSVGNNDPTCIEGTKSRQRNCTGKIDKEILSCSNDCPEVLECKDPRILIKEPRCEMSCFTLQYPETCSEDEDFSPRCGCKEGYVIDEATDNCIPVENCVCYKSDGVPVNVGMTFPGPSPCQKCTCNGPGNVTCETVPECCEWKEWTSWGECDNNCESGVKRRYRDLIIGNSELCGSSVETDSCAPKNTTECHVCEVDGVSYGVGDLVRAQNGGCIKCYCYKEGAQCLKDPDTNVDGNWSDWSPWSQCSMSCNGGQKTRTRQCNDPMPLCDGAVCGGKNQEYETCNEDIPCCAVGEWSDWSDCLSSCNPEEERIRSRKFLSSFNSTLCPSIELTENRECPTENCTCIYTYAPNSMCVSDNEQGCGKGSRQVLGTLQSGGEDCPQEHVLVEECHLPPCECDKKNEMWSTFSTCAEKYCANLTSPVEIDTNCNHEGCICADNFFRNEQGACVTYEECAKCQFGGEEYMPGALFQNKCEKCECVNGEVTCAPMCNEPTGCLPGEVLEFASNDSCCRSCIPEKTTCEMATVTKVLEYKLNSSICTSDESVTLSYCTGGCGASMQLPQLMLADESLIGGRSQDPYNQHCKCCTGEILNYMTVQLSCPDLSIKTEARIPQLRPGTCKCNACMQTESTQPSR
ncbi:Hypothetical predicted protein [Mytilus galloprovincialis]|uniref:SCO-spondin n=1 Tax=Mytilus galloprovincialis TaxID=29158 RepID=A0A8B6G8G4_MYTGA|nr:Hypothetical predicted protein [Mytilus galloprovincialis]